MTTQLDRIQWILDTRGISQRELSRRAGLAPGHVGVLMDRLRERPGANLSRETAEKLARGGEVRLAWLWLGEGEPDGPTTTTPERPDLTATLNRLRSAGRISEASERAALAMAMATPIDFSEELWAMIVLDIERELQKPANK